MKNRTVKDITLEEGKINCTLVVTHTVETPYSIDVEKFQTDYANKLEDYQFQNAEINRLQALIDSGSLSDNRIAYYEHLKAGAEALKAKYLDEWNGIYKPINTELNIL